MGCVECASWHPSFAAFSEQQLMSFSDEDLMRNSRNSDDGTAHDATRWPLRGFRSRKYTEERTFDMKMMNTGPIDDRCETNLCVSREKKTNWTVTNDILL